MLAKVGAIAVRRVCGESAPSGPPLEAAYPTPTDTRAWLTPNNLLPEAQLPDAECLQHYLDFSKCSFGERVAPAAKKSFMKSLLPWGHRLAATQFDIGCVSYPAFHYELKLNNTEPIHSKPLKMRPEEEVWLNQHLDELEGKGVIAKLGPEEQPTCVTSLLLVPGIQSSQAYRVC